MLKTKRYQFWFITGSQHLYGPETLQQVENNSKHIVDSFKQDQSIPYEIVYKPIVKTPNEIYEVCQAATDDPDCAGVITWMHTFSPSKMWIAGLSALRKPLLHLHTQFNRDIPWDSIDMDFMNLNQSAHGDREHGFIGARMGVARKVVAGHWENAGVRGKIAGWMRTAAAITESRSLKVARFGDNMREVAVTEGDKVEAQIKFGWSINGYGIGDLVERVNAVSEEALDRLMGEYETTYTISDEVRANAESMESIRYQARIELALKSFLEEGGFTAFTTTFEDLHGMKQLPGLAVQRLMEQGYGFAGEGDWKTAALTRMMKIMADNEATSFMEDYTYHFEPGNEMILGAHMLEVCPTISATKPRIEVHPLGIGGKEAPARIIFDGKSGTAVNASLVDLGSRFRLIINEVEAVQPEAELPKLPVARVLWKPAPSLAESAEAWIYAGGAHHTVLSYVITTEQLADWAEMANVECVVIDQTTNVQKFRSELRWNDLYFRLR
ncbi:L-arabinose isomerase [Paenibacillus kobensis]|uniref:L-arabinose isomerase n=1 Tax=Paenibacillus kobensis TaxID=59841 RepID=UPI000FD94E3D|nr:L-arabinose isomerase [Paenibacillus kobensis]